MQLTRDPAFAQGFLSAGSVIVVLSSVYTTAADEIGKIHIIADERVRIKLKLMIWPILI